MQQPLLGLLVAHHLPPGESHSLVAKPLSVLEFHIQPNNAIITKLLFHSCFTL